MTDAESLIPPQQTISSTYTVPADLVPIKVAAQVAGLSPLWVYELVATKRLTRYGVGKITVSLTELLTRHDRKPPQRRRPDRPRNALGQYLPGPAWVTYDTTDGSVGCGAD